MKTDRSIATRAAAVVLAGLLVLAAGQPAGGQISIHLNLGKWKTKKDSSKELAGALAAQMQVVQQTFNANRKALHLVTANGKPAYHRQEVAKLIAHTEEDLDKSIDHVQPAKMDPLRFWAADAIESLQVQLTPPHGQTAASFHSGSTPRAVAVVASLGGLPLGLASVTTTAPQPETVPAATADGLLDQVENVISRIFVLASHEDLEVELWVGSTVRHATFSFWSQGQIKKSAPEPTNIRTDGKKNHILRGLYAYQATHAEGAVTEFIRYPNPAGAPAAQIPTERLDLVNGTSFFCCRFQENYCQHVATEKECHS
jgi:hypothetical protein